MAGGYYIIILQNQYYLDDINHQFVYKKGGFVEKMAPCVNIYSMIGILVRKFNRPNLTPMKLKLRSLLFSTFVLLMFSAEQNFVSAQAQLVLGATATYMNISGGTAGTPIYLVVGNPASAAIIRTNGHIISEGQWNYVKWLNTAVATSYTIPFGSVDYLPFTFAKTAGVAADLTASTYATPNTNLPWCAATNVALVNNMNDLTTGVDGSVQFVIDRWWTINTTGATANLSFTYRGAENTMAAPATPADILGIQHWDGTKWNNGSGGAMGTIVTTATAGSNAAGPHTVTGSATFNEFSPYVLVSFPNPLPVQWLSLSADCDRGDVTIHWSTASEQNADYFTVERSLDGTNFSAITTKPAAGNSNTIQYYSAVDTDPYSGTSFYRVKETDFNGAYIYSGTITVNGCAGDDVIIYGEDGGAVVNINASADGQYNIEMYNVLGQKITGQLANVTAGNNQIKLSPNNVASAIYVVKVFNNNNAVTKKVFIRSTIK